MSSRLVAVSFDVRDAGRSGAFWAGLLGREIIPEASGVLVPGEGTQVGLRFVETTADTSARSRLHLHLTSRTSDDQRQTIERALGLGGRRRGTRPLPIGRDIYLAGPGGDEFCVIEPGNAYLAGCGFLGEVTCDGTRSTGLFWLRALEWRLVWDQGEQIAIQSPRGGTKIAWDGDPGTTAPDRSRQRFDLSSSDLASEVERLRALGATRLADRAGVVMMADPDGSEFTVSSR